MQSNKFKNLYILLFLGLFFFNSQAYFAQSLEGKWNIAKLDTRHSTLVEFTADSLVFYEFDKRRSATAYQIKDKQLVVEKGSVPIGGNFEFVNPNRLRLNPKRAKSPIDFVRLTPTKTNLTKTEIQELNFEITYQGHKIPLKFDGTKDDL